MRKWKSLLHLILFAEINAEVKECFIQTALCALLNEIDRRIVTMTYRS